MKLFLLLGVLFGTTLLFSQKSNQHLVINPRGHKSLIYDVAIDAKQNIITGSFDKTCIVWNPDNGRIEKDFLGNIGVGSEGMIYAVDVSPDNKYLAVAGWMGKDDESEDLGDIRLYDYQSKRMLGLMRFHADAVFDIKFTKDSKSLISGDASGYVIKWDVASRTPTFQYKSENESFSNIAVSQDYFCTGHPDGMVYKWDFEKEKPIKELKFFKKLKSIVVGSKVQISQDGEMIVVSGKEVGMMLVLDAKFKLKQHFFTGDNRIINMDISPDNQSLSIAIDEGGDNYLALYRKLGKEWTLADTYKHDNLVSCTAFLSNERVASIGGKANEIAVLEIADGKLKPQRVIKGVGTNYYSAGLKNHELAFSNNATKSYGNATYDEVFDLFDRKIVKKPKINGFNYPLRTDGKMKLMEYQFLRKTQNDPSEVLLIEKDGKINDSIVFYPWDGNNFYSYSFVKHKYIVAAGSYGILQAYDLNGNLKTQLVGHEGGLRSVSVSSDEKFLVTAGVDMTVRFWSLDEIGAGANGAPNRIKPVASLFISEDNEWVLWNPDGYFTSSKKGAKYVGYHINQGKTKEAKFYPFDQFDLKFNRPDILLKDLDMADADIIDLYRKAYEKRLKRMGINEDDLSEEIHAPEIKKFKTEVSGNEVNLSFQAVDEKYDLKSVNVFINDVPLFGRSGKKIQSKLKLYEDDFSFDLIDGENKIEISVLNKVGVESLRETVYIKHEAENQGDLYIVGLGVSNYENENFNLQYAAKDAEDVVGLFESHNIYQEVHSEILTNEKVTKENILNLKSFFAKAKANDVVLLFIAGHGVLDVDFDYYYCTHNMDFNEPSKFGISYAELEQLFDGIKAVRKLLIMDTCHSGELFKDEVEEVEKTENTEEDVVFRSTNATTELRERKGLKATNEAVKEMFNDLNRGTGTTVISSSGGVEYAMESENWKNGLFTYSLLEGITTLKADLNKDGKVYLSEIQEFVHLQVSKISGGKQKPTSRYENISLDYRLW